MNELRPRSGDHDSDSSNDFARKGRVAFWVIVAAATVAMLVTTLTAEKSDASVAGIIHVSCTIFLCLVSGLWLGLGKWAWRILLSFTTTFLTTAAFAMTISQFRPGQTEWVLAATFCFGVAGVTAATGFVLRLFQGELRHCGNESTGLDSLQFNIRHLLIWTTAVAGLISLARLIPWKFDRPILNVVLMVLGLAAVFGTSAVVQIWALLGNRATAGKFIALLLFVVAACFAVRYLVNGFDYFWVLVVLASQALTAAAIVCLRMQGYRFAKVRADV